MRCHLKKNNPHFSYTKKKKKERGRNHSQKNRKLQGKYLIWKTCHNKKVLGSSLNIPNKKFFLRPNREGSSIRKIFPVFCTLKLAFYARKTLDFTGRTCIYYAEGFLPPTSETLSRAKDSKQLCLRDTLKQL